MTKDPVCGKSVDEKTAPATSTFEGRNYAFCSHTCKDKFDRSPEQYPARSEQQSSQGQQRQSQSQSPAQTQKASH